MNTNPAARGIKAALVSSHYLLGFLWQGYLGIAETCGSGPRMSETPICLDMLSCDSIKLPDAAPLMDEPSRLSSYTPDLVTGGSLRPWSDSLTGLLADFNQASVENLPRNHPMSRSTHCSRQSQGLLSLHGQLETVSNIDESRFDQYCPEKGHSAVIVVNDFQLIRFLNVSMFG